MAVQTFLRYFVGRADLQNSDEYSGESPLLHVLDSFFIGNRHLEEREWVIAVDAAGDLRALPGENRGALSESLQNELAFSEISRQRPSRFIEAIKVYLFNLQVVEQVGKASPGLNDPIYLYGTLYEIGDQSPGIKGQLTVTRGDLLAALVSGFDFAFRYNETNGAADGFSRCFNLMLPGDTEAEIKRGAGIVLAYPLFPAELLATGAANEIIISQLIYDLLDNLKEDLKREQIAHPLLSTVLPVPNRFELEQELQSKGYEIKGDTAIKKNVSAGGFKGLLASVFGALTNDELIIPREGTVEDFLLLARQTLHSLQKDFLTSRAIALRNCLKAAPPGNYITYAPPPPPSAKSIPQNSAPMPVRVSAQKRKISGSQPPAWMRDFISAHKSTSKITSTFKMKPPIISATKPKSKEEKQKEWLSDFAETSGQDFKNDKKKARANDKPDWMKDFE